ncbi:hypothetical protein ACO2Q2_12705 [Dyella sp. KRB-257]|uniref:hypothetical protein n=1 Tax=Dyella sp. KRB-257 TaxID=3400915 RepID=UPI003BFBA7E2
MPPRRLRLARHHGLRRLVSLLSVALLIAFSVHTAHATTLDAKRIGAASGAAATTAQAATDRAEVH